MEKYLPYIVSVLVSVITGLLSYLSAVSKSNRDLKAMEKKYEMEIDKLNLEHAHRLELMQKEAETNIGASLLQQVVGEAMKTPEARQAIGQAIRNPKKR